MSEPTAPTTSTGAIHDIGYRHYDGPRLGASYIRRSLFVETLRGAFGLGRSARSKVMPFLLLSVMVLPAVVIGIVAGYFGFAELPLGYTEYVITVQVAVTIFLGAQSPAVMSRDLRFRVASLYFSRPLSRRQYVQAKYAGMATALFLLMGFPITLLLAGALLAELPLGEQVPDYVRAMAEEFGNETFSGLTGLISPYTLVDGVVAGALGAESSIGQGPPGAWGTALFVAVMVLLVIGCYAGLVRRYKKALS